MEQSIKAILSTIDDAVAQFQDSIPGIQKLVYEELQPIVKDLQVKNGKLLNNIENLKLIGTLQNKLEKIIISAEYKKSVQSFVDSFTSVSNLNNEYFSQFNKKYKPKNTLPIIKQLAIESTINDLVGQGLSSNVIAPIQKILQQNITTGGSYAKFQEQLQNHILQNETGEGNLQRYTKQITTDAINQYNAQYGETVAQDLQFNWGRYVGSNITTTREFCTLLTEKQWVHKSELTEIIKGHIDGTDCKLSKTTGLPLGMIPDTNADNFKIRRGGYNCGHQFFWVPDSSVPLDVRKKFENKGKVLKTNFVEEKKQEIKKIFTSVEESAIERNSNLSYDAIVSLTGGIPKDSITNISHNIYQRADSIISEIHTDQYKIVRSIHYNDKWIYNDLMKVYDHGGGIGLNLFVNQVREARSNGFKYLKVSAAGDYHSKDKWNGYITWAKFGYEMLPNDQLNFLKLMQQNNRIEKTVFELVSTKEGLAFWEKNGSWWDGKFDLSNNSKSMQNLQKYLADRNINVQL